MRLFALENLLWDVILGCEFLSEHESINIKFGGPKSSLQLAAFKPIKIPNPVRLFEHLSPNCRPVATKRRNYSTADQDFISNEIKKLLADDVIKPSTSPWRAQVMVTKNCNFTFDTSQKESENSFPGVLHDVNDNVDTVEVSNEPVQNVPHLPGSEPF